MIVYLYENDNIIVKRSYLLEYLADLVNILGF